jgi:cysteinyl-tRNA synthetase
MKREKYTIIISIGLLMLSIGIQACKKDKGSLPIDKDYKQEMRGLVQQISAYSKAINQDFVIIPQNGAELLSKTGDETGSPDLTYLGAINGIGQEDLFYGYNNDDEATPGDANTWISGFLEMAKSNGDIKIMVTDYCSTPSKMDDSYSLNSSRGYISFAADHRELDNIPTYPPQINNENNKQIKNLQEAENFLYLISPDNEYASPQAFVDAVGNTNYDFVIMDFFFDGQEFTADQIAGLKQKANGGSRLLICYMSIGEAEDYRYYWQEDWKVGNPSFIEKPDPNWPGNYYVRYWEKDWQNIIFGNDSSYLKKILDKGFDGVYLDIIDAFEQFESSK